MVLHIVYADLHNQIQGPISSEAMIFMERSMATRKDDPVNIEYETRAKNLLKGELKRRGVTYAHLAERLAQIGVHENERNLNNKISRGGFSAAFFLQCLAAIQVQTISLS
jgi:hypothetical protein